MRLGCWTRNQARRLVPIRSTSSLAGGRLDGAASTDSPNRPVQRPGRSRCSRSGRAERSGEMGVSASQGLKDVAFYYPGPFWYSAGWIKNLLLFFDGLALL